jgi:F-type H+-transporting ATPase subunit epsilon
MQIEIITPEETLFSGEADSIIVPGTLGDFHMLKNHAPIVSSLKKGAVKIYTHQSGASQSLNKKVTPSAVDAKILEISVMGGVVEFAKNRCVVLAE